MSLANYRSYLLNHHEHITNVQVVACESLQAIERTARELLDRHVAAAAVEVWERDDRICRVERIKAAS